MAHLSQKPALPAWGGNGWGPGPDDTGLTILANGEVYRLSPGESFTFGRAESCTLCLDPDDAAISRLAGEVERVGEVWFVTNRSASRQFAVVDGPGLRAGARAGPARRRSRAESG